MLCAFFEGTACLNNVYRYDEYVIFNEEKCWIWFAPIV